MKVNYVSKPLLNWNMDGCKNEDRPKRYEYCESEDVVSGRQYWMVE